MVSDFMRLISNGVGLEIYSWKFHKRVADCEVQDYLLYYQCGFFPLKPQKGDNFLIGTKGKFAG